MRPVEWPLVGRRDEVAWLDGLLAAVEAGQGGVAVLTGPAGIGKTRLLDELARRHQPSTLVLRGRASEFERTFPFGVVIDVLDDYLKSMDGAALDAEFPEDGGYETVAGFVLAHLGSIPRAGEAFDAQGLRFEVLEASPTAVLRVRVRRAAPG